MWGLLTLTLAGGTGTGGREREVGVEGTGISGGEREVGVEIAEAAARGGLDSSGRVTGDVPSEPASPLREVWPPSWAAVALGAAYDRMASAQPEHVSRVLWCAASLGARMASNSGGEAGSGGGGEAGSSGGGRVIGIEGVSA